MASVSVYRSNAMYALGTKTLTLPNQDGGWKSAPPTQLCNYHDNHCQQRPDWAGSGKVQTRCLPVKASSEHCWGCVKIAPSLPYLFFPSRPDPLTWAIQLYRPRRQASYVFGHRTGLEPGCARCKAKPRGNIWTKSDRFTIMTTEYTNAADNNRYKVR